jgi:hypothetical protein
MVRRNLNIDRDAWNDRFRSPSVSELRAALKRDAAGLFERACRGLRELQDAAEAVVWNGECWKWTVAFEGTGDNQPTVVIIPNPSDLQVAARLSPERVRAARRLAVRRAVREGLDLAADPFDSEWCVWSVSARGVLDEIVTLLGRVSGSAVSPER